MINIGPLAGSPGFLGSTDEDIARADMRTSAEAGFDAVTIEILGDTADAPSVVGSGEHDAGDLLTLVQSIIVGSALKAGGDTTRPIDPKLARGFGEPAR